MKPTLPAIIGAVTACLLAGAAIADPPPVKKPNPENSLGAAWRQQQDEARQGVRQRRLVPLQTVIDQLRRRTPGRQLDTGLEYDGDRAIYRVRWMTTDGRRIDYMIDAATGAILSGQ